MLRCNRVYNREAQAKARVGFAVGHITDPKQAEAVLRSEQADMVALGRAMLNNPRWAWQAAESLNAKAAYPPQYRRSNKAFLALPVPRNPPVATK
mgnify:FL=1